MDKVSAFDQRRARVELIQAELRTMLSGVDPGLVRLRLAGIGTVSMMLAAAGTSGVRWLSGLPVTVVLVAAVLAMISNLAVNESEVPRLRVTTLLLLGPALVSSRRHRCGAGRVG